MSDTMKQCRLMKITDDVYHHTCWLPAKYAVVGKFLEIEFVVDEWSDGWIVTEVWTELPTAVVRERSQDYKRTRKASDI